MLLINGPGELRELIYNIYRRILFRLTESSESLPLSSSPASVASFSRLKPGVNVVRLGSYSAPYVTSLQGVALGQASYFHLTSRPFCHRKVSTRKVLGLERRVRRIFFSYRSFRLDDRVSHLYTLYHNVIRVASGPSLHRFRPRLKLLAANNVSYNKHYLSDNSKLPQSTNPSV